MPNQQVFNAGVKYITDLTLAYASTTTLTLSSGQCRDSTNKVDMFLTSGVTIDFSVNGLNGLDTGSIEASKWYTVYLIGSSVNQAQTGAIVSLSASAPVLPFGYDCYRVIAKWRSDGSSHLIKGYYAGNGNLREFYYDDMIKVQNDGTSATLALIDLDTAVPPIQNTPVYIQDEFTPATANDYVSYFPGDSTGTVGPRTYGSVAAKMNGGQHKVLSRLASSKAQIKYINSASSCNVDVWVYGYEIFV